MCATNKIELGDGDWNRLRSTPLKPPLNPYFLTDDFSANALTSNPSRLFSTLKSGILVGFDFDFDFDHCKMPSSSLFFGPPEMVVKNRFLGFLIWQSIPSTFVFFLFKIFVSAIFSVSGSNSSSGTSNPSAPFASMFTGFFTFLTFHLSQLLFSASLSLLASPQLERPAAPLELTFGLVRFLVVSGGDNASSTSAFNDFRRRATVSLYLLLFVVATAISGSLAAVSICWGKSDGLRSAWHTGLSMGLIYGAFYVYNKRWVLTFPIIQVSFCSLVCNIHHHHFHLR